MAVSSDIDVSVTLADGGRLHDVSDLKAYLIDRVDLLATCLTENMFVYSLRRELNFFGDRQVVKQWVRDNLDQH